MRKTEKKFKYVRAVISKDLKRTFRKKLEKAEKVYENCEKIFSKLEAENEDFPNTNRGQQLIRSMLLKQKRIETYEKKLAKL